MSSRKNSDLQTLKACLSAKTLQDGCTREEIKTYFLHSYSVYQKLFSFIKEQKSFYTKPEPLRHPLIFYYGHTACVYINKLFDKGLITSRINQGFESIFAVGVDQMDWDDLNDSHYDWPAVRDVTAYRDKVKNIVLQAIDRCSPNISWDSDAWVIMMGIEHERIHLQTSSVIIRRLPIEEIHQHQDFIDCPIFKKSISQIPINDIKVVPSYKFKWDRQIKNATVYGWDNQFGEKNINVEEYRASSMLVSNGEFLQFVQDQGYQNAQFWDQQGKAWLKSIKPKMPLFWAYNNGAYTLRTMSKIMPLPVDWPVEVNNLQATAFCNWKSSKTGKKLRLPTEDEYYAMRYLMKKDHLDSQYQQLGNINMEYWFSPNPVDYFKTGDFYDIVGNVWQHCSTPIYPFENFQIHPIYEDFTTPTFDGRHCMIKGGSFVSTGNQALKHARYAFRRHFHQFAGFRYVQSDNLAWCEEVLDECDQVVEKFLKIHYLTPNSYVEKVIEMIERNCKDQNDKCLTVGCSVGRIVLQMSKYFNKSYGTDYSARFFQMATRLYQKGLIKYKDLQISLQNIKIKMPENRNKIILYQMNPQNLDTKKLTKFNMIIFDGLSIRNKRIQNVLKGVCSSMKNLMEKDCKIILINLKDRNKVCLQSLSNIFGKISIVENAIVGPVGAQDQQVELTMYSVPAAEL